jgi:hypothetical protein
MKVETSWERRHDGIAAAFLLRAKVVTCLHRRKKMFMEANKKCSIKIVVKRNEIRDKNIKTNTIE